MTQAGTGWREWGGVWRGEGVDEQVGGKLPNILIPKPITTYI